MTAQAPSHAEVAAKGVVGDAAPSGAAAGKPAEAPADCLACRVTGTLTCFGAGGYLASRLLEAPAPKGGHRVAIIAASACLAALGVARAVL